MNDPKTVLEPLAGLVLDEIAKLRNELFVPHSMTKLRNLMLCKRETGAETVVEIGTFKGVTAQRLARRFKRVISVEIDPELHKHASRRLQRFNNVELILGDGCQVLPEIASRVQSAVLFLDGHFSGGNTGMGDEPEPVLKELDVISSKIDSFAAIIVDDFRLFGVEKDWPKKSELLAKAEERLPSPRWTHAVLNDQLICLRR
jgi:hypothetical protein